MLLRQIESSDFLAVVEREDEAVALDFAADDLGSRGRGRDADELREQLVEVLVDLARGDEVLGHFEQGVEEDLLEHGEVLRECEIAVCHDWTPFCLWQICS